MKSRGQSSMAKLLYNIVALIIVFTIFTNCVFASTAQLVTVYDTKNENNFPEKLEYDKNGSSGVLYKDGDSIAEVVSGEYTPGDSKQISDYAFYSGTNQPPSSYLYNIGGYTGNISLTNTVSEETEIDYGYDETITKDVEREFDNTVTSYYDADNNLLYSEYSWDGTNDHDEVEVEEDGFKGTVYKDNAEITSGPTTETNPDGSYQIITTWTGYYSGTLEKNVHFPDWQTAIVYTGYYSGTVYKAEQDTRVFQYTQAYKGKAIPQDLKELNFADPENSECVGEPVNIVTGNYYTSVSDLKIPDRGIPLEIVRSYNSLDTRTGILGKAWRLNYESSLSVDIPTGNVKVIYPDGHTVIFYPISGSNEFAAPIPVFDRLTSNIDGTYTLKLQNKLTYNYNANGQLGSISDTNGNTVVLTYGSNGYLNSVMGASGRMLDFSFENGKLKTITDPAGRTIVYTYDSNNNLLSVKGAGGGTTQYEYAAKGLKSITDSNNRKFIDNVYDEFGRVSVQYDEEGNETRYYYDEANMENTCTFVSTQSSTKYQYDDNLFINKKTFADGSYEEYTYDQWGKRNSVKDRNGNTTDYVYDERGNLLSETAPDPFNYTTIYSYDENDNLLQLTTAGGGHTSYEYDAKGNIERTTFKLIESESSSTVFAYDGFGRITSITDAEGHSTVLEYGVDDNPVKVTDPEGNIIEYGYDSLGRRISITTYLGSTYLEYNANDKIEKITDVAGNVTRMKYDAMGNLIKMINPQQFDPDDDDGAGYTSVYDSMDRLIRQIDPLGNIAAVKYDQLGQITKRINPNYYNSSTNEGAGTGYEYDDSGRITHIVNPSGQKSRIVYDAVGNKTKIISANNYNEGTDNGLGMQYYYDQLNRLVESRDTNGNVTKRQVYDPDNRVIKEIDGIGYLSGSDDATRYGTIYKYNLAGWLIEKRVPAKMENGIVYYSATKYIHDLAGKILEQKSSPQYVTIEEEPNDWNTITYTYYKNSKIKSISDSLGSYVEYSYDSIGNTTSEKSKIDQEKWNIVNYHYNSAGLIDKVQREIDGSDLEGYLSGKVYVETVFEYDKNGNITKVTRPEGYVTTYKYDSADRLIAKHEEVQQDQLQLKSTTASVVFPCSVARPGQQYECSIDIHTDSAIKDINMIIEYDARAYEFTGFSPGINGILIDGGTNGLVHIRSSGINIISDVTIAKIKFKLKQAVSGIGYITIDPRATYVSADGTRNRFSELSGKSVNIMAPDINNSGTVETDDFTLVSLKNGLNEIDTGYDEICDINGDGSIDNLDLDYISEYLFNETQLSNLSQVKFIESSSTGICDVESSTVIRTTTYSYDCAGNLTGETDCNGNDITYSYDAYNRLISVVDKSGAKSRVFYDEVGNRVKEILPENYNAQTDNGVGTTYVYDSMNRLVEVKDTNGITVQKRVYNVNGLLTKLIDAAGYSSASTDNNRYGVEYTYDIGNRVSAITSPEAKMEGIASESYTYDALGYVLSFTDGNGNITQYERDMWGKIIEVTDASNISTQYAYDYAGNLTSSTDGNNHTTIYEYNSLNKLASITDPASEKIICKYDKEGRLIREQDRNGNTIEYGYNSDDSLTGRKIINTGEKEQYLYNKDGSMLAAANITGIDEFQYTPDSLLVSRTRNGKPYISYEYNKNGAVTKVTDGSGISTTYGYDTNGRMKTVSDNGDLLATYNYNIDSTVSNIIYNTGISVGYSYDRDKNITVLINRNPQNEVIGDYSYTYDNNGNQLTNTENGLTTIYTYDELNRLETVNYPGLGLENYTYDNAGNRISKTSGTENITYSYDERNRLTQSINNGSKTSYIYDNNGNMISSSKGPSNTIHTYDGFNRLVEAALPDGQTLYNEYDAFGLRTSMYENGAKYQFTLDGGNVIAENPGQIDETRYIRGISLIAQKDSADNLAYYLHNAHGDVTNLVDGAGLVLNSYTYDAFGDTLTYAETIANRFRYAGEQFDKITGQYYLRARFYDPATSRMLTEDPARAGLNWYTYCNNNPVNFVDPYGLDAILINKLVDNPTKNVGVEHMGAFFQDENDDWWFFFWGDTVQYVEVDDDSIFDSLDTMNQWLIDYRDPNDPDLRLLYPDNTYRDSVYIKGDFTASHDEAKGLRKSYKDSLEEWDGKGFPNQKYNVVTNNCGQVTMSLFEQGTLPSGTNVGDYMTSNGYGTAVIPNWNMINMQAIFYNKATNLAGFEAAMKTQRAKYEGQNSFTQWWYTELRNNINTISKCAQ